MRSRLISLILLTPASGLLFATIVLLFLFMTLNIQGWAGCLAYLPLALLAIYLVVLPKVLLSSRVKDLLRDARVYTRRRDLDSANRCYEQALDIQEGGTILGLSMVLKEYSHFLRRVDEREAEAIGHRAIAIQKDALLGKIVDDFDNLENEVET